MQIPRLSRIEYEILNLLRSKEMYGLELVRSSSRLKRGTIYVTLERMSEKGYVHSREADRLATESGMPRRMYSISALGVRSLAATEAAVAVFAMEAANA